MLRRVLFVGLPCLFMASALLGRPAAALSCQSWDTTCKRLQQAQQTQQNVQNRLQQIQQGMTDIQQKSTATVELIHSLNTQIDQQKKVIAATKRKIRYTAADISRRQAQLAVRQQLLDQRVRAMDKHDSLNYFELVVTSQSFSQLVDRLTTMQDIIRSDRLLVDQLKEQRTQIQQQQTKQAALLQQQQDQKAQLDLTLASQQAALAYYEQLEAQYQQQAQILAAQNQQLIAQIQQLQQQYDSEARGFGGGSGRFAWPEGGMITQGFGCTDLVLEPYSAACATRHFHQGLDIGAAFGTTIGAGDAGVVASAVTGCSQGYYGCGGGYGNQVVIVHGNGYSTLYAHLSAVLVSPGQGVRRGQAIGREGSTGASTGPHLHFAVMYNGRWVDPQAYLA
jgi:murein DD-endopeptidase MepM/ murein hydrolase activator NlpD